MESFYVKDGKIYQQLTVPAKILITSSDDLNILAGFKPGTIAYTAGGANKWYLSPEGQWVPSGNNETIIEALNATENKTYTAEDGHAFSPVVVEVPTLTEETLTITSAEAQTYTAPEGTAYTSVVVNIPAPAPEENEPGDS